MSNNVEKTSEMEDKKLTEEELDNVSGGKAVVPKATSPVKDTSTTSPITAIGKVK